MGYIAKADGVISENEIREARKIMLNNFKLNKTQILSAMNFFNEGKQSTFSLENTLGKFVATCGGYTELMRYFLELQVRSAMADGVSRPKVKQTLSYICSRLGLPVTELEYFLRVYRYNSNTQEERFILPNENSQ